MLYSTIRSTELLFADLKAETDYTFRVRAVNADGASEWGEQTIRTKVNPLEFAIEGHNGHGIGSRTGRRRRRTPVRLRREGRRMAYEVQHQGRAVRRNHRPACREHARTLRLPTASGFGQRHHPRGQRGLQHGPQHLTEAGTFSWKRDAETKSFAFDGKPSARYIRISVTKAVGDYGSGREIYVFRVPARRATYRVTSTTTAKIDHNDLTSYMNYTGLRLGDSDFEGYISRGDIDGNNLIDAYDISVAATRSRRAHSLPRSSRWRARSPFTANGKSFKAGDMVEIRVSGHGLKAVNALSFALPYDQSSRTSSSGLSLSP